MSNFLRPHGLEPTSLLCPWGLPGKNVGVGCRFLLQRIFPTQGSNPGLLHCRQILSDLILSAFLLAHSIFSIWNSFPHLVYLVNSYEYISEHKLHVILSRINHSFISTPVLCSQLQHSLYYMITMYESFPSFPQLY